MVGLLEMCEVMSMSLFARKTAVCWCLAVAVAVPAVVLGQTNNYITNGVEYAIAGSLPGDQTHPSLGLSTTGGYIVWEDNLTDGDGLGISARQLNSSLSGILFPFPRQRHRRGRSGTPAGGLAEQAAARCSCGKGGGAAISTFTPASSRRAESGSLPPTTCWSILSRTTFKSTRRWRRWPTATWWWSGAATMSVSCEQLAGRLCAVC